ncbi:hypothetical protein Bbelb_081310 [Branchiostoma belcheri]|nr:hypothetical protein Bbelb_081310 [Branchiostoma belcheri]
MPVSGTNAASRARANTKKCRFLSFLKEASSIKESCGDLARKEFSGHFGKIPTRVISHLSETQLESGDTQSDCLRKSQRVLDNLSEIDTRVLVMISRNPAGLYSYDIPQKYMDKVIPQINPDKEN